MANLKEVAKSFGIKLKKGNKTSLVQQIKSAGVDRRRLEDLVTELQGKKKPVKKKKKTNQKTLSGISPDVLGSLEARITRLEQIVSQILKKNQLGSKTRASTREIQSIKSIIKSILRSGDSKTIDEIVNLGSMKSYNWITIEQALLDLIDDEVFDVSEGKSVRKLDGRIARLIRR